MAPVTIWDRSGFLSNKNENSGSCFASRPSGVWSRRWEMTQSDDSCPDRETHIQDLIEVKACLRKGDVEH
jgi:hypothetical protein